MEQKAPLTVKLPIMKTHLPKKLLVALLAAMTTGVLHAEDTPSINISYSEYNAENQRYNATMTITGPLGGYSANGYTPCYTAGITGAVSSVHKDALYTVTAPEDSGISVDNRPLFVQDATINMSGASLCYLTAGANSNGGVYGAKTINISNGYVNFLFGGDLILSDTKPADGYYAANPDNKPIKSTGPVTINISGGVITHSLGVGVNFSGPSPLNTYIEEHGGVSAFAIGGDATINISGDSVIGGSSMDEFNAAGGRYASVDGKLTVNISGGTINSDLFCGARGAVTNADGSIDRAYVGSAEVNISGGTINADVYGGNSYSGSGGGAGYTKGDTRVTVSGGIINGDVYGGGDRDEIKGSTHVELSGGTITGDVYAGGSGRTNGVSSIIGGNTTVTLSGSSLNVGGTIYGGGKENCTIAGTQTLNIGTEQTAFTGSIKVADFSDIVMVNGSATITQLTAHQNGTALMLGNGTTMTIEGDFAATTITYNGGSLVHTGELSANEIILNEHAYTIGEATFYGGNGDNGFVQAGKRTSNDVITATGYTSITDNTGTQYTYDSVTGKAYAEGEIDFATYYINTEDHTGTVSEMMTTSDNQLEQVEMKAGVLNADASAKVNATGGSIFMTGQDVNLTGTLSGDTNVLVLGTGTITGDNTHTGDTVIAGENAKLTVGSATALGASTVTLQDHGTLDLNGMAVSNAINVTGCTISRAGNYDGTMEVSGELTLTDATTAKEVIIRGGSIEGASLRTTRLEVSGEQDGQITSDVTIADQGSIVLNNGAQLNITGSLTLGQGTTLTLAGDGYEAGSIPITWTGTLTGDTSALTLNMDGDYELVQDGDQLVLVEKTTEGEPEEDKPIVEPEEDEPTEEPEEDAPIVEPEAPVAPVFDQATADALAQANWGVYTASRAFVGAVQGQRNNTGCIANGRGTAWGALLGATNSIDSNGIAGGSDTTLYGAAIGVDMKLGKRSVLGVAFGYTDAKVSADGLGDIDQEGGHIALYGEHGLKKFANNSCLSLDWVAATGTTESSYRGSDWEQDHLQLNTRVTWNKKVTERFAYNVFGGLEYFASESDRVQNCKTGSVQNLRGELGLGARYVVKKSGADVYDGKAGLCPAAPACERVVVYGEISYINDMVRNNPSIEVGGLRGSGANPGRQGVGIEAGATFRIGERWSANANYSFNAMDDANEHSLNLGASRTF